MSKPITGRLLATDRGRGYTSAVWDGVVIDNHAGGRRFIVDDARGSLGRNGILDEESREALGVPQGMLHRPTKPLCITSEAFKRAQEHGALLVELD